MSNDYFQFKQFRIGQGSCAMKVTTDACIQGAWTPVLPHVKRVLDIGTGTGLLALMLAQRNSGITIDAIEIDENAAAQARDNATVSPWKDRVHIMAGDVRDYKSTSAYDLIISNPPFFNNSLLSNNTHRDTARHTLQLNYNELLQVLSNNMAADGYASILLPVAEYQQWVAQARQYDIYESSRLSISHTEHAAVKRIIGLFSKNEPSFAMEEKLVITGRDGHYTQAFTYLLSSFYLHLGEAQE